MIIKPSLVILTWNRKPSVEKSLSANIENAGYPLHEIVHVDNGSLPGFTEWFRDTFKPSVQIAHKENTGVAVGYNRGLALTSGTHVIITGCDRVMPKDWLSTFVAAFENIKETAVVSCYTSEQIGRHHKEHGQTQGPETRSGIYIQRSIPVEARMHSKEFLFKAGFFREDFGLYGYEDSEWSDRACRVAAKEGKICYHLPLLGYAEHISDQDFPNEVTGGKPYYKYKSEIHQNPKLAKLFSWCHKNDSPHYNPYTRVEPDKLQEMD